MYDVSELYTQVPEETAVRFVRGSHKMGWFTPRKFATKLNYEKSGGGGNAHDFKDVPVADIEAGRFGPALSWATQPGDVIAFYGMFGIWTSKLELETQLAKLILIFDDQTQLLHKVLVNTKESVALI